MRGVEVEVRGEGCGGESGLIYIGNSGRKCIEYF